MCEILHRNGGEIETKEKIWNPLKADSCDYSDCVRVDYLFLYTITKYDCKAGEKEHGVGVQSVYREDSRLGGQYIK